MKSIIIDRPVIEWADRDTPLSGSYVLSPPYVVESAELMENGWVAATYSDTRVVLYPPSAFRRIGMPLDKPAADQ